MQKITFREQTISSLFIIIPLISLILGIIYLPDIITDEIGNGLTIILFTSLVILLIGFIFTKEKISYFLRIAGWSLFGIYWSTQVKHLYYVEAGDFVNAFITMVGVFFLFYLAYQEWISLRRDEKNNTLTWAAGVAAIAGIIYYGIEMSPIEIWLREVVTVQSAWLLNIFTGGVEAKGVFILYKSASIRIIFACTAVQSMVIFVGMILPLQNISWRKKGIGLLVTVVPVYFLNLVRNAMITLLVATYGNEFFPTAHNIIGKGGSLVALIILLLIVVKIIPEVLDEIVNLTDLYKRNGPLERMFKKYIWRKK